MSKEIGEERLWTFGTDKVALKFLQAVGEAMHILCICTFAVETATYVELMEESLGAVCYNFVVVSFYMVDFEFWCIYLLMFGD